MGYGERLTRIKLTPEGVAHLVSKDGNGIQCSECGKRP
jgi:hypothetical protein